eukprot:2541173-Rhodomonas_salina.1
MREGRVEREVWTEGEVCCRAPWCTPSSGARFPLLMLLVASVLRGVRWQRAARAGAGCAACAGQGLTHPCHSFCDIRNFTDCTEVLGAEIVHLVNNIATHVHQAVIDN